MVLIPSGTKLWVHKAVLLEKQLHIRLEITGVDEAIVVVGWRSVHELEHLRYRFRLTSEVGEGVDK